MVALNAHGDDDSDRILHVSNTAWTEVFYPT